MNYFQQLMSGWNLILCSRCGETCVNCTFLHSSTNRTIRMFSILFCLHANLFCASIISSAACSATSWRSYYEVTFAGPLWSKKLNLTESNQTTIINDMKSYLPKRHSVIRSFSETPNTDWSLKSHLSNRNELSSCDDWEINLEIRWWELWYLPAHHSHFRETWLSSNCVDWPFEYMHFTTFSPRSNKFTLLKTDRQQQMNTAVSDSFELKSAAYSGPAFMWIAMWLILASIDDIQMLQIFRNLSKSKTCIRFWTNISFRISRAQYIFRQ